MITRSRITATTISIHAPRTGSDASCCWVSPFESHFNPRSPHGERLSFAQTRVRPRDISIHAPRTGSDLNRHSSIPKQSNFNPRSPHGERRRCRRCYGKRWKFQSTLPARGATRKAKLERTATLFQSTLPARGATLTGAILRLIAAISIHAPRTGSDPCCNRLRAAYPYFNPRSPHGERPDMVTYKPVKTEFQSTLPARGATVLLGCRLPRRTISIHAPRTGSDSTDCGFFNSPQISIHAPRTGSDRRLAEYCYRTQNFNPRSPHGERRR